MSNFPDPHESPPTEESSQQAPSKDSKWALDPEVAKRVAGLTLRAKKAVEGLLSGMHRSPHRGASVVFVEHREYRPGDDPRLLDWRAFARNDRHSIKRFEQETQLRSTLVLDRSGSMAYPEEPSTRGAHKGQHGATLLAALAYLLMRQGDAPGVATFDASIVDQLPSRSRASHLDPVIEMLSSPPVRGAPTELETVLSAVGERIGRRGVVAIASDLLDLEERALDPLNHLVALGHDVMVFHVLHPDELDFPFHGGHRFEGCEGESPLEVDADEVRTGYLEQIEAFVAERRRRCIAAGARYVLARTDQPPEQTLATALS